MHRLKPIKNGVIGLIGLAAVFAITLLSGSFAHADDLIQLQGVMIRPKAGNGLCLTINGSGATNQLVKCDPNDGRQRNDLGVFGTPAPVPAPTPAPSTPAPEEPKTQPAETKPGATVPLTLTTSSVTSGYQSFAIDDLLLVNNTWGVKNIPAGAWSQSVGMVRNANGNGVDVRFKWDFSRITCPKCDVISYPEVAYGRSASFPRTAGAAIPKRINELQQLTTSYDSAEAGVMTKASHIAYDLWTSRTPDSLNGGDRLAEVMLPEYPFNGYGVPNSPAAAAAGRTGPATGRNPHGYQGREVIGGAAYDVYYFPPKSPYTNLAWKFIVYAPVVYGGANGASRDWLPILGHAANRGWVSRSDYLNAVELGVEPAYQGSAGDVTVRGYQVNAK